MGTQRHDGVCCPLRFFKAGAGMGRLRQSSRGPFCYGMMIGRLHYHEPVLLLTVVFLLSLNCRSLTTFSFFSPHHSDIPLLKEA